MASAQAEWNVDYNAFLDNREYKNKENGVYPGSLLGGWLTPSVGYRFEERHALYGGAALLQEFGSDQFADQYRYVAYYQFLGKYFDLKVGAFSFTDVLGDYPGILVSDSIFEYTPVMTGVTWQLHRPKLVVNSWLDWVGRQSDAKHEEFVVGSDLKWKPSFWYAGFQTYLRHYAATALGDPDDHVTDAGMTYLFAGVDLSNRFVLDSLTLQVGYIIEESRVRGYVTPWIKPSGFLVQLQAEWRGLGVKNTCYAGDGQYALSDANTYGYGGSFLYWGDPYYRFSLYNRTDFILRILQSDRVQAYFSYSLHYADHLLSSQQQFMLRVNIGNMKPGRLKARREQNQLWKSILK
jgi:hypothetical protein